MSIGIDSESAHGQKNICPPTLICMQAVRTCSFRPSIRPYETKCWYNIQADVPPPTSFLSVCLSVHPPSLDRTGPDFQIVCLSVRPSFPGPDRTGLSSCLFVRPSVLPWTGPDRTFKLIVCPSIRPFLDRTGPDFQVVCLSVRPSFPGLDRTG